MQETSLYETQYGTEKALISVVSFPFLRRVFSKYDLHREDLALQLLKPGSNILDVGCGSGSLLFKAKDRFEKLYGVDISPSRISQAQKYATENLLRANNLHFLVLNVNQKLDFPDSMFDVATSIQVIEHVFDPYFVVGEIHRVLKKGGIFIANVPNIAYIKRRINLLLGRLPVTSSSYPYNWKEIGWDGGHLHYFTAKTFCRLLEESGFTVLKITGSGLFAKFRNFYPSLLTGDICVKARKC
jgi:methionine biosynthesis protein MetW